MLTHEALGNEAENSAVLGARAHWWVGPLCSGARRSFVRPFCAPCFKKKRYREGQLLSRIQHRTPGESYMHNHACS